MTNSYIREFKLAARVQAWPATTEARAEVVRTEVEYTRALEELAKAGAEHLKAWEALVKAEADFINSPQARQGQGKEEGEQSC